jgi:hypothetical protein
MRTFNMITTAGATLTAKWQSRRTNAVDVGELQLKDKVIGATAYQAGAVLNAP